MRAREQNTKVMAQGQTTLTFFSRCLCDKWPKVQVGAEGKESMLTCRPVRFLVEHRKMVKCVHMPIKEKPSPIPQNVTIISFSATVDDPSTASPYPRPKAMELPVWALLSVKQAGLQPEYSL